MGTQYAGRLALIAIGVVVARGMIAGRDFTGIVQTALFAAIIFWGLGRVLGDIAKRLVEEQVRSKYEKLWAERQQPETAS
ncbi:hypothetical protein [Calycomorphotria hydatis]|uniref:Uncharacterized protein n=1 Tax=Calycomorphotria hydatis TaxID=2528027 RepID=A0A517TEH1_9PLAN|nr:hypothetical protein [Calycomorphotria hydatis]QDT66763.1 hypothetical protein V22_40340 [Calycomorphotria hydatis]